MKRERAAGEMVRPRIPIFAEIETGTGVIYVRQREGGEAIYTMQAPPALYAQLMAKAGAE